MVCKLHRVVEPRIHQAQQPFDTIVPSEGMYWSYRWDVLASPPKIWWCCTKNALKMLCTGECSIAAPFSGGLFGRFADKHWWHVWLPMFGECFELAMI